MEQLNLTSHPPGDEAFAQHQNNVSKRLTGRSMNADHSDALLIQNLLATKNGEPQGCLSLYLNPVITIQNQPAVLIGRYQCIDDTETACALLQAAAAKARAVGAKHLLGPMNGSTWHSYRFAIDGNAPPFTGEPHHPHYYTTQWKTFGFTQIEEYFSSSAPVAGAAHTARSLPFIHGHAIIRGLQVHALDEELAKLYPLVQAAFAGARFFSPVSEEEFIRLYQPIKTLIQPHFALVAEDAETLAPLGFMLAYPDMQDEAGKTIIMKTAARDSSAPAPRLIQTMHRYLVQHAAELGYSTIVHALMHADNVSFQQSLRMGFRPIRTYGLFAKVL